ncbi:DUF6471 domain-containing protein [Mesorhizobium sp. M0106]|uniref:DUF6471 domain-containing protein n=1 Tax=Mesorhizobium sp. M0106 TaxID=2956880 RepID=UPI00333B9B9D
MVNSKRSASDTLSSANSSSGRSLTSSQVRFETRAKNLLKAELKRRGFTYAQLAEKLAAMDIHETERNLNNKISRGDSVRRSCYNA